MISRTWLVAVMHGDNCVSAENIVGSRNYIPRLLEICFIVVENNEDISDWEIILVRDNWRGDIKGERIRQFAEAHKVTLGLTNEKR